MPQAWEALEIAVAARGAIHCDINTALSENEVASIFADTLVKRNVALKLVAKPSIWEIVAPPPGAISAAEWVRDKRQQRMLEMGKGENVIGAYGTIIALRFSPPTGGRTVAHLFTSEIIYWNGKIHGALSIRRQMKRVASVVADRDPSAQAKHYEDDE